MATTTRRVDTSRAHRLAQRLKEDIRMRGLCAGDRYLTAAQVAERLGVSVTSAHHALKILADQKLVSRHRNSGTFVGPLAAERKASKIRTIHILMPADYYVTLARTDMLMQGIRSQNADASVQFNFLPDRDVEMYVKELISMANAGGEVVGIVAIRCPREVYRLLAASGIPTIVCGTLFPGESLLPSIDSDAREAGRMLTRYLVDRGHRRIALLTGAQGWPGDNDFFDGVSQVLTMANLPADALLIRIIPHDATSFSATTKQLLAMPDPPSGFITRGLELADMIAVAAAEMGRRSPEDIEVVFQDNATTLVKQSRHVHVQPQMCFEEMAILIGKMLRTLSEKQPLESLRVVIPVELRGPGQ